MPKPSPLFCCKHFHVAFPKPNLQVHSALRALPLETIAPLRREGRRVRPLQRGHAVKKWRRTWRKWRKRDKRAWPPSEIYDICRGRPWRYHLIHIVMTLHFDTLRKTISEYFNLLPDMEDRQAVVEQISQGVSFRGANLWVLIFAIFIASLGLNVNSTAVIIGAMLISPLMGPIIGMGLAIGINDIELFRKAGRNFAVATLISVLTAMVYFLVTPLDEAQSELLARTSPTIYDVLIATFGGAAGITALCTRGKGNVIPGVAIATALMPPLCTAGFGLATGNVLYFLGAFYLFFINTVFITISTYLGVRLMRFPKRQFISAERATRAKQIIWTVVVLTMVPATVMTLGIVRRGLSDSYVRKFVKNELSQSGTQVISQDVDRDSMVVRIVAVGKEITPSKRAEAERRLSFYGLGDYRLTLIQGAQSDSLLELTSRLKQVATSKADDQKRVAELTARVSDLHEQLESYTRYVPLSVQVSREAATLFPQVESIVLTRVSEALGDTAQCQYVAAIVHPAKAKRLSGDEQRRFGLWLKARTEADSVAVFVAPR